MRKVLVTGGAGFIGAHLVRALTQRGDAVRILDNLATGTVENLSLALSQPSEGIREALTAARAHPVRLSDRCEILLGDIRDAGALAAACEGVEIVFHQAALRSVPRSVKDPVSTHEVNGTGTLRLLEAGRGARVRLVVNASSSSVYGDTPLPKHEAQLPHPRSPYAASKLAAEAYCQAYARVFGLQTVSLRYFNVFGPWQDPASEYAAVIPKFIRLALLGEALPVDGDGRQSRDFMYVDNVVEANLLAAEADLEGPAVLNVGSGGRYSVLDLVAHLEQILQRRLEIRHAPARPGDMRDTQADIGLAHRLIGYTPQVSFAEGLRITVQAMRETGEVGAHQGQYGPSSDRRRPGPR